MSKSIEALNRIETVVPFNRENKPNYYSQFMQSETPFYEDFDLVKKDLEVLEEYKSIEEELEIDLSVLFSALKNGVYYFDSKGQLINDFVILISNSIDIWTQDKLSYSFITFYDRQTLSIEDYGKTWSLDKKDLMKEELEHEN